MTKILSLMVLVCLITLSCQKEIELEQPAYQEKIVVDGYIETGQPAHIFLTMSSPFLTQYDSASIRASFLNYAKITLSSSLGEEEVLTLFRENQFFPPFVYKSVDIKGQEGIYYQIKVEVMGQTLKAETIIPPAVEIVGTRFIDKNGIAGYWEFAIDASKHGELYLFTRMKSHLAHENFHPSFSPVYKVKNSQQSLVWLRLFRSPRIEFYLSEKELMVFENIERYVFDRRDTVELIVGTIDATSYKVLNSLFIDRLNQENPFAFNGNRIETNIEGGIGRWTGIGIKNVTLLAN